MSEYLPEVAWSTIASNVSLGPSSYRYYVTTNPLDPNEPGASIMTMVVGDWFIDYAGYPFLIENILGSVITVYDILERGDGITSAYGPYADKVGFVYRPKNGAFLLTQAQLRKLDASAIDIITPIEKGIIWKYRGIEIDALYGDNEVIETIAQESVDNITKLSLSPEFILRAEEDGWQGGKKYSLSLDGLLHNNLQGVQGTGLDDDYIHLDQDQIDALWTKDGLNITRDSAASLTGILSVDEIKSYTSTLPLIKKDGNNVRFSTCILSDCVNNRVGIFTETPLDHLHLTGYARISTLAETANSSIVTSNADGRLIKLPYDNDKSKYLRSDGTWAPILTSAGDFLDSVIRMVVDSTFDLGTPTNGDRYIILNASSIHANFGTINKFSDGSALTLGNNDIVQYFSANSEFRIVYDSSAAMQPATVTVGTDKNGNTNHQWTYNVTDDTWIDRGAIASHNSLGGLNDGDYKHLTAAQYTNFISLTDGSDISNTLHNHNTLYAIKQTSATDTAAGRGMIVGAFGLGTIGITTSLSDNSYSRLFWTNSDTPTTPSYMGIKMIGSTGYSFDIAARNDRFWVRTKEGGTQQSWKEIYHTGNLVNPTTGIGAANRLAIWSGQNSLSSNSSLTWGAGLNVLSYVLSTHSITVRTTNKTGSTINSTALSEDAWNNSINYSLKLTNSNNAMGFIVGGVLNNRVGMIQVGHDDLDYAYALGVLSLSPLGGGVAIGKTTVESGYILDTNGSVKVNGNIIATGNISARNKLYLGITTPPVTDTGTLNALVWDSSTGEVKQRAITGGSLQWVTSGSDIYYNGGNVGVGTAIPIVSFQVKPSTNINLGVRIGHYETSAAEIVAFTDDGNTLVPIEIRGTKYIFSPGDIEHYGTTGIIHKMKGVQAGEVGNQIENSNGYWTRCGVSADSSYAFFNTTNLRYGFYFEGTGETVSFLKNGNVGIGRTPTTHKFEVEGSELITTKLYLGTSTAPTIDTGTLNSLVWDNTTGEVKQRAITGGSGATTFLELTDTPNTYDSNANKFVTVKADNTGLQFDTDVQKYLAGGLYLKGRARGANSTSLNGAIISTGRDTYHSPPSNSSQTISLLDMAKYATDDIVVIRFRIEGAIIRGEGKTGGFTITGTAVKNMTNYSFITPPITVTDFESGLNVTSVTVTITNQLLEIQVNTLNNNYWTIAQGTIYSTVLVRQTLGTGTQLI